MVRDKRITGISDIRDESNKEGIRIVFELKRGETPEVVYNNLLNCSQLKMSYGINMVALVNKKPRLLNLKQILSYFLEHRKEVVSRRTIFDLNKSRNQAHMLEGLLVAVANIDEIISTIRSSKDTKTAKEKLLNTTWKADEVLALVGKVDSNIVRPSFLQKDYGVLEDNSYRLSPQQAQGILELRLQKLTGLEQKNLTDDYKKLIELIIDLADILSNKSRLIKEIEQELEEMQKQYGDERNTEIQEQESELDITDLIAEETVAITMSDQGYIKSQPISEFKTQKRGGKGKISSSLKDTDIINNLVIASNHDKILCFSDKGKVYWLRVLDVPKGSRISKGRPIVNLLPLEKNEVITAILPLNGKPKTKEEEENNNSEEYKYILMATLNGVVKKTLLSQFARPRPSGLIALNINPGDKLITVLLTTGNNKIMMASSSGKVNHFDEKDVRSMGRTATGVRGIRLNENEKMISTMLPKTCELVITVSENGFGKISPISEFPIIKRGGRGVIGLKTSERNGKMIECQAISDEKEFLLISDKGIMVRTRISDVPVQGRSTQGVRLIKLQKGDKLIALSMLSNDDKDNDDIDNNEQESKEN
jgi:DNA gyrase subunit A